MKPTEQAEELCRRINYALTEMKRLDRKGLDESEVLFRLDAISGILIIALQDARGMRTAWYRELRDETAT